MLGVVDADVRSESDGIFLVGDVADGEFCKGALEIVCCAKRCASRGVFGFVFDSAASEVEYPSAISCEGCCADAAFEVVLIVFDVSINAEVAVL